MAPEANLRVSFLQEHTPIPRDWPHWALAEKHLQEDNYERHLKHKYLGIDYYERKISSGYYVGLAWLDQTHWIGTTTKLAGLDYWSMFVQALSQPETFKNLQELNGNYRRIYEVSLEEPLIPCSD